MKEIKKYILTAFTLLVLLAFKSVIDNQSTLFDEIKLVAIKNPKYVSINLSSDHFLEMEEIIVERSAEVNGFYRQIKILYKEEIHKASKGNINVLDNYPLSLQSAGFYRVRVKLLSGISRIFPGVQEISYDSFNALRDKSNKPKSEDIKKPIIKDETQDVVELEAEEKDRVSIVRDEHLAQLFETAMMSTKFNIQRQSEFERKISIELPQIDKVENIYVMMNNLQDQSYFTIKEFDKDQIVNENLKGKLEYIFKLEAKAKPGTTYSIKLRLTSEIYHYETPSQQFN